MMVSSALMVDVHHKPQLITTSKQEAVIVQMGAAFFRCRTGEEVTPRLNHRSGLLRSNTVSV